MKMKSCLLILFLIVLNVFARAQEDLNTKMMDTSSMLRDFRYLRSLLEETHPGLYRYTTKEMMQAKLDSSAALLQNNPLPFFDFYKIVEGVIADIHCAHTYALPVTNIDAYFNTKIKTLPFFLFPIQEKLYVLFNCTKDESILPGFELLNINGRPADEIKKMLTRYYWADGHIELSKNQVLQGPLFDIFYYSFVERPDNFHLTFKTLKGDTVQYHAPAQLFGSFAKWIDKNPVNKQMSAWYNKKKPKHPWRLSFPDDVPSTALLRLDEFGGEGSTSEENAKKVFRAFMDKSIAAIQEEKCTNLIIDVRSNSGGWDIQGIELFSYIMKDSAVKYYGQQHSITTNSSYLKLSDVPADDLARINDKVISQPDGTFILKEENEPVLQLQYPKSNRFKGKVYILQDEKTFSTAAEFTSAAYAQSNAVFVGEESGGSYEGGNGGSFIHTASAFKNCDRITASLLQDE